MYLTNMFYVKYKPEQIICKLELNIIVIFLFKRQIPNRNKVFKYETKAKTVLISKMLS